MSEIKQVNPTLQNATSFSKEIGLLIKEAGVIQIETNKFWRITVWVFERENTKLFDYFIKYKSSKDSEFKLINLKNKVNFVKELSKLMKQELSLIDYIKNIKSANKKGFI